MANIKLSGIVTDISGTIGGTIFQKGRSGHIMRTNFFKGSPKSELAIQRSNIIAYLQYQWQELSQSNKDSWKGFVNFAHITMHSNNNNLLTGREAFIKLNYYPILYGYSIKSTPSYLRFELIPTDCDLGLIDNKLHIHIDKTLNADKEFLILFVTFRTRSTINNPGGRYRILIFDSGTGGNVGIRNEYINLFGNAAWTGDTIFMRWCLVEKETYLIGTFNHKKVTIANL